MNNPLVAGLFVSFAFALAGCGVDTSANPDPEGDGDDSALAVTEDALLLDPVLLADSQKIADEAPACHTQLQQTNYGWGMNVWGWQQVKPGAFGGRIENPVQVIKNQSSANCRFVK